jgi:hypothetical protein
VIPMSYELDSYILFKRNSVFKGLINWAQGYIFFVILERDVREERNEREYI